MGDGCLRGPQGELEPELEISVGFSGASGLGHPDEPWGSSGREARGQQGQESRWEGEAADSKGEGGGGVSSLPRPLHHV